MRSAVIAFVILKSYRQEGEGLVDLYQTERGARARIYEEVTRWEGRLLWWPQDDGAWRAQVLMPDYLRKGKYKLLGTSWSIELRRIKP
jgi:hypothetical protein